MSENLPAVIKDSGVPAFAEGIDTPEDILKDNLKGRTARLPQIKILHAGAQTFQMPDGKKVENFKGIILDTSPTRAYWASAFTGGKNPPSCWSVDGLKPDQRCENKESISCAECPHNLWGSDPKGGKGKACKEMARIHFVGEGMHIPYRLVIPPSGIRALDQYMSLLVGKGLHYNHVMTRVDAVEARNDAGIKFTGIELNAVGASVETKEEYVALKNLRKTFLNTMRGEEVIAEEYIDEREPGQEG